MSWALRAWRHPLRDAFLVGTLAVLFFLLSLVKSASIGPLWLDEVTTWRWAHLPFDRIHAVAAHLDHMPFYYWLMALWVDVSGKDEVLLRLPSGLFVAATIPIVYIIGRKLITPAGGLAAALLFAVSPSTWHYAADMRPYGLLALLFSLFLLGTVLTDGLYCRKGSESRRPDFWQHAACWALMSVPAYLMAITHFTAFSVLLIYAAACGILLIRADDKRLFLWGCVPVSLCLAVLFFALPIGFQSLFDARMNPGAARELELSRMWFLTRKLYGFEAPFRFLIPVGAAVLALVAWRRNLLWYALLLFSVVLLPISEILVNLYVDPVFTPKTFMWTLVPLSIIFAVAIFWVKKPFFVIPILAVLVALLLPTSMERFDNQNGIWDSVATHIRENYQESDMILMCPDWDVHPLAFYLYPDAELIWRGEVKAQSYDIKFWKGSKYKEVIGRAEGRSRVWLLGSTGSCKLGRTVQLMEQNGYRGEGEELRWSVNRARLFVK